MAGGASWQENGMVRTDDLEDRLVAGVIIDLEGIDDKQTGTSRVPLTTARFSGLYGFWYPHERDDRAFAQMLVNECRASVLAMQAIREVNPRAQLVQTEDIGKVYSTPLLAYQAEFENERRWVTLDRFFDSGEHGLSV